MIFAYSDLIIFMVLRGIGLSHVISEKTESILTFLLARHGQRGPCHLLNIPEYPARLQKKHNQLTKTGAEQHILLGNFIRFRYPTQLSAKFDKDEIFVRASSTERTLMSANYFLYGLYHQTNESFQIFPPVYSSFIVHDDLLKMSTYCPKFKRIKNEALHSKVSITTAFELLPLFITLQKYTGLPLEATRPYESFTDLWEVCDALVVWRELEPTSTPAWLEESVYAACKRALSFKQYIYFSSASLTYLRGGPLALHITRLFRYRLFLELGQSALPPGQILELDQPFIEATWRHRLIAYFAHDSTLAALFSHLGIFNGLQPPLASALLIELYRGEDSSFRIRFLYRNVTDSLNSKLVPLRPKFCGPGSVSEDCPFDAFEAMITGTAAKNVRAACEDFSFAHLAFSGHLLWMCELFFYASLLPIFMLIWRRRLTWIMLLALAIYGFSFSLYQFCFRYTIVA